MPHLLLPPFPPGPTHCYIPTYSLPTMSCLLLYLQMKPLPPCAAPPAMNPYMDLFHHALPITISLYSRFPRCGASVVYAKNSHYAAQYHWVPTEHATVLPSTSAS